MKNRFGQKLRALRTAREFSLRGLAAELAKHNVNVTHATIANWETAGDDDNKELRLPAPRAISALATIYAVDERWLLAAMFPSVSNSRVDQFADVELLTDAQFAALLAVKDEFLKNQ